MEEIEVLYHRIERMTQAGEFLLIEEKALDTNAGERVAHIVHLALGIAERCIGQQVEHLPRTSKEKRNSLRIGEESHLIHQLTRNTERAILPKLLADKRKVCF